MTTLDDDTFRRFTERISELSENLGRRVENARESVDEEKNLSDAERFLRQKEIKEREDATTAIKAAREREAQAAYAAAQADWDKLSATEQQQVKANELAAEATKLAIKENLDKEAYNNEVKKINEDQQETFARRAKYELESLGFAKDSHGNLHKLANEREAIEKKLIEDLQKGLDESPALQQKYGADAKNAKLAMEQERLYKQQLASMGRYVDSNGKLIDTTVKLTKEQEASVKKIKQETESREASIQAVEQFNNMLGMKGAMAAGGFALTTAFDFLKASIVGTYKGLIAYEDALLDGVRGQSVEAAMISEQQNAYADALDKAGGSLVSFGGQLIVQAAQMALTNIPMALLAAAIAGVLAVLGYASQAQAAIIKRDAELNKKRAALEDEVYKNFLELGEASVTGARGVTGLIDDLKSVGLTIKEFEKLNKILSSNTREIAMFGSTTMAGVKSFIEVTGGLINSEMSKTFEKMGISQNSQMEHAQKYMAMQARFGLLEGKSKQDLIKGTQNYINELDKTAALTGASRKEQETARDFAMAQAELRAAIFDEREKAKGGDQEAAIRVKELQGQMELVAKLKLIGQDQLGIGVARNAAAGQIVDPLSAKAVRMLGESIEAYKTGAGTEQSRVGALGEELRAGFKDLAPLARIKADAINGLAEVDIAKLVDGMDAFTNVAKLRAEFEADPKNKGKTFDDKALDEMLSRVAKDPRTENSMEIFRKTQEEALAKQTALLNGQLGAANQMLEAAGMFGKAGKTMLDAGRQIYNAAFKGTEGEAENIGVTINKKQEEVENARARKSAVEEKIKKGDNTAENREELALWENRIKTLEKEKALLQRTKEVTEDKAAIEDKNSLGLKLLAEKQEAQRLEQGKLNEAKQKEISDDYKALEKRKQSGTATREEEVAYIKKESEYQTYIRASMRNLLEKQAEETKTAEAKNKEKIEKQDALIKDATAGKLTVSAPISDSAATTATIASNSRKARVNKKPEVIVDKDTAEAAREDTAPEAPKKALGGVVPATINGTTVTVGEKGNPEAIMPLNVLSDMLGSTRDNRDKGEKGKPESIMPLNVLSDMLGSNRDKGEKSKPEAIMPLDALSGMLGSTRDNRDKGDNDQRYAQMIKLNSNFSGSIDISSTSVELEKIGNELSKDNNKLIETEIKTSDKLIISMNKVTDMLPNVLSQIIAATYNNTSGGGAPTASGAAPTASGAAPTASGGAAAPTASGGAAAPTSTDMLRQAGLILKKGDVQADGKEVDPRIIEIAKQVQASIPGFMQFTGFNDQFHNENTPGSKHTKGKAFDFVLSKAPSKEEAAKILAQMKSLGIDYAQDEYNNPSSAATGGHFHGQLNAFDGGVFEPRPGGVHVNLAEAGLREAAVPLNPGEKIRVEKPESDNNPPRKDPLSTVLANDNQSSSNSNQSAEILASLHELMEDKFDSMISALRDGNNISDKILKYSQA